ncbi:endolytic transglycosylase MltG [Candidatus Gottesmanbacteria bacterium]|nr:endolytic transglycosylase MltG [Candidatus Gottesmanbacteria bacterium]
MFRKSFLLIIMLTAVLAVSLFWWLSATSPVNIKDSEPVDFVISSGQNVSIIANNLKSEGLIKNAKAFLLYTRISGISENIQAGNYELNPAMSVSEIANQLTHGVNDVWVKIIEGWRVEEIADYLYNNFGIDKNEFIQNAQEGYMFPDSYRISADSSPTEIASVMRSNFYTKVTEDIKNGITAQGLTLHQGITLASILEREVKNASDRPIVAGIYLKRLNNNWPLQADATVQYIVGFDAGGNIWWKKHLTASDLEIDSPYNTYIVTGLPPGPIANPGLATIKAVANPKDSDYWYYISDDAGTLHYAKTIEEHNQNIVKYLH